jgi:DNA-binding NarL/FixJ family response regulator
MALSVFLVEDIKSVQAAMTELLAAEGRLAVVGTATTEAEANLWLEENAGAWNVAIIDLILDQGTGMGVIAAAKKTFPDGHIVVFSDFASPAIEAHCLRIGANAVIDKAGGVAQLLAYCAKLPGAA